jgi:hypothetical protein
MTIDRLPPYDLDHSLRHDRTFTFKVNGDMNGGICYQNHSRFNAAPTLEKLGIIIVTGRAKWLPKLRHDLCFSLILSACGKGAKRLLYERIFDILHVDMSTLPGAKKQSDIPFVANTMMRFAH